MLVLLKDRREQQDREELFQSYVCQALWDLDTMLRRRLFDLDNDMPQYIDLIKPEAATKPMSAEEIKQRTIELFKVG